MGLFSRREKVPAIPTASPLPPLPPLPPLSPNKDLPGLPSFPTGSRNQNLNQEMVKSAVSDVPSLGEEEGQMEMPRDLYMTEELSGESGIPLRASAQIARPQVQQKPDDVIFIRIDKFQAAQKNLDEIKSKVIEIESVLKKIKEVRLREEKELKGWTEDTEKLKSRLAEIDGDIFNQL